MNKYTERALEKMAAFSPQAASLAKRVQQAALNKGSAGTASTLRAAHQILGGRSRPAIEGVFTKAELAKARQQAVDLSSKANIPVQEAHRAIATGAGLARRQLRS